MEASVAFAPWGQLCSDLQIIIQQVHRVHRAMTFIVRHYLSQLVMACSAACRLRASAHSAWLLLCRFDFASPDPLRDPKSNPPIRTQYYIGETRGCLGVPFFGYRSFRGSGKDVLQHSKQKESGPGKFGKPHTTKSLKRQRL